MEESGIGKKHRSQIIERPALKIKDAHKNPGNELMMTQLGNASRSKRSEVNVSTVATADSGLTFHRFEEQRQVFRETLSRRAGWGRRKYNPYEKTCICR